VAETVPGLALNGVAGLADAAVVDVDIDGDSTAVDPHAETRIAAVSTVEMRPRASLVFMSAPSTGRASSGSGRSPARPGV
jgi:hypothetical protein